MQITFYIALRFFLVTVDKFLLILPSYDLVPEPYPDPVENLKSSFWGIVNVIKYYCKKLRLRYLTGFWIWLSVCKYLFKFNSRDTYRCSGIFMIDFGQYFLIRNEENWIETKIKEYIFTICSCFSLWSFGS